MAADCRDDDRAPTRWYHIRRRPKPVRWPRLTPIQVGSSSSSKRRPTATGWMDDAAGRGVPMQALLCVLATKLDRARTDLMVRRYCVELSVGACPAPPRTELVLAYHCADLAVDLSLGLGYLSLLCRRGEERSGAERSLSSLCTILSRQHSYRGAGAVSACACPRSPIPSHPIPSHGDPTPAIKERLRVVPVEQAAARQLDRPAECQCGKLPSCISFSLDFLCCSTHAMHPCSAAWTQANSNRSSTCPPDREKPPPCVPARQLPGPPLAHGELETEHRLPGSTTTVPVEDKVAFVEHHGCPACYLHDVAIRKRERERENEADAYEQQGNGQFASISGRLVMGAVAVQIVSPAMPERLETTALKEPVVQSEQHCVYVPAVCRLRKILFVVAMPYWILSWMEHESDHDGLVNWIGSSPRSKPRYSVRVAAAFLIFLSYSLQSLSNSPHLSFSSSSLSHLSIQRSSAPLDLGSFSSIVFFSFGSSLPAARNRRRAPPAVVAAPSSLFSLHRRAAAGGGEAGSKGAEKEQGHVVAIAAERKDPEFGGSASNRQRSGRLPPKASLEAGTQDSLKPCYGRALWAVETHTHPGGLVRFRLVLHMTHPARRPLDLNRLQISAQTTISSPFPRSHSSNATTASTTARGFPNPSLPRQPIAAAARRGRGYA
nr:unnamed protein product [Digitaria exilis]